MVQVSGVFYMLLSLNEETWYAYHNPFAAIFQKFGGTELNFVERQDTEQGNFTSITRMFMIHFLGSNTKLKCNFIDKH